MTIKITQTCNKCKKERNIRPGIVGGQINVSPQDGGWRTFDGDKHVCPDCMRAFAETLS